MSLAANEASGVRAKVRPRWVSASLVAGSGFVFGAVTELLNFGLGPFSDYTSKLVSSAWCWALAIYAVCCRRRTLLGASASGLGFLIAALAGYLAVRLFGTGGQFGLSDVPMYVRFYLQPGIALIAVSALVAKVRNRPGLLAILASVVIPGVAMWTAVRYGGPSQPEVLVSAIATVGCLVFLIVSVGRQVVRYAAVRRTRGKVQITGR